MSAADRSRAYRLRSAVRRGETLKPEDSEWLERYEQGARGDALGVSASRRIVSLDIDEQALSAGTGEAARDAAANAALAREEGRRLDYLTRAGIEAMVRACELHERMCASLLERTKALEEVHLSMLDAVREQYLARTQAEIDAMHAESNAVEKPDTATELIQAIVANATQKFADKPAKKEK